MAPATKKDDNALLAGARRKMVVVRQGCCTVWHAEKWLLGAARVESGHGIVCGGGHN
ncbi:glycosyl transferase [Sesbania bispinosa]|nr:glycosyl transferase [Sesbania bispinosa]